MSFVDIFSYVSIFSVLIPFGYSLYSWKNRKKSTLEQGLFLLLCTSIISELLNTIYVSAGHRGLVIYNLWFVAQFIVTFYIYKQLLGRRFAKFINSGLVLFLVWFLSATFFINEQHIQTHQNWVWTVGGTIVILMAIAHLFYLSKTVQREPHILKYGPFWISIALIGYFVYSISLFFMAKQIHSEKMEPATSLLIWNFHNLNYIIRNLLLTLALYHIATQRDPHAIDYKKYGIDEDWRSKMKPNPNLFKNTNEEGLANG